MSTELRHRFKLRSVTRTDVGRKRTVNQDSYGHAATQHAELFIVADGMGGAKGGELASAIAVNVIPRLALRHGGRLTEASLKEAIENANKVIFKKSKNDEAHTGMGTTVVAFGVVGTLGIIGFVGDSRIYRFRDSHITCISKDHTLVQELVDSGAISAEEAVNHPVSHVITRSLGPAESVQVDIEMLSDPLRTGDRFLLCCDGLYNHVQEEEFQTALVESDIETVAEKLIALANERGGTDNITVTIVDIGEREQPGDSALSDGEMDLFLSLDFEDDLDYLDVLHHLSAFYTPLSETTLESSRDALTEESVSEIAESSQESGEFQMISDDAAVRGEQNEDIEEVLPVQESLSERSKKFVSGKLSGADGDESRDLSENRIAEEMTREQAALLRNLTIGVGVIVAFTVGLLLYSLRLRTPTPLPDASKAPQAIVTERMTTADVQELLGAPSEGSAEEDISVAEVGDEVAIEQVLEASEKVVSLEESVPEVSVPNDGAPDESEASRPAAVAAILSELKESKDFATLQSRIKERLLAQTRVLAERQELVTALSSQQAFWQGMQSTITQDEYDVHSVAHELLAQSVGEEGADLREKRELSSIAALRYYDAVEEMNIDPTNETLSSRVASLAREMRARQQHLEASLRAVVEVALQRSASESARLQALHNETDGAVKALTSAERMLRDEFEAKQITSLPQIQEALGAQPSN